VTKRLVDVDDEALAAARARLGTKTGQGHGERGPPPGRRDRPLLPAAPADRQQAPPLVALVLDADHLHLDADDPSRLVPGDGRGHGCCWRPTATATTTMTDPYVVPEVIDAACVSRVIAGLDAALGDRS
jgi:hypothetical protein